MQGQMRNMPIEFRLWSRVKTGPINECWEWQGNINECGYGCIGYKNRIDKVHRVSYELANGKIPKGKCVCHSCDNPKCVNPHHLWIGTFGENNKDRKAKGRNGDMSQFIRTECVHGHKYTKENTVIYINKFGHNKKSCRTCDNIGQRKKYYRLKKDREVVT